MCRFSLGHKFDDEIPIGLNKSNRDPVGAARPEYDTCILLEGRSALTNPLLREAHFDHPRSFEMRDLFALHPEGEAVAEHGL